MILEVFGLRDTRDLESRHLLDFVKNKVEEGQHLEFIANIPPANSDPQKADLAKKIAAMANSGGGVVVLGIAEKNGKADRATPVPLKDVDDKIRNVLRRRIEPHLPIDVISLDEGKPGEGFVVVATRPTGSRPFALLQDDKLMFFRRDGQTTNKMLESDVARLYRMRFLSTPAVGDALDALRDEVSPPDVVHALPRAYVACTPIGDVGRLFTPNRATIEELRNAAGRPPAAFGVGIRGETIPPGIYTGFRRLRFTDGNDARSDTRAAFHTDGRFLGIVEGAQSQVSPETSLRPQFYPLNLTAGILGRLTAFVFLASHFGLRGEIGVQVGVTKSPSGFPMLLSYARTSDKETHLFHAVQARYTAEVDDLATAGGLLEAAKPMLDDVFSAFRWSECPYITDTGRLHRDGLSGQSDFVAVQSWAEAVGADFDEPPAASS